MMIVIKMPYTALIANAVTKLSSMGPGRERMSTVPPPNRIKEASVKHTRRTGKDCGSGNLFIPAGDTAPVLRRFKVRRLDGSAAKSPTKKACGRKSMVNLEVPPRVNSGWLWNMATKNAMLNRAFMKLLINVSLSIYVIYGTWIAG